MNDLDPQLLHGLPGAELIQRGMRDLRSGRDSAESELVQIGGARLRRAGLNVTVSDDQALDADHRLYDLLARKHGNEAHSRYNALLRELISFERALEQRMARQAKPA